MVKYEEETSQKTYLFEVYLVPEEEIVPLRVLAVEDHVPISQVVLQIVQLPYDIPEDYPLILRLGVIDESVAFVGRAGSEEQMKRQGQLNFGCSQLEVQDGLEELCGVDFSRAFELPREQFALLAREVVLQQILLESFCELEGQLQGKDLQREVQLVLLAVLKIREGLVAHMVQLQAFGAELIETELLLHAYLQGLAFFLPQAFQLIAFSFLEVVYFQGAERSPHHHAFCKAGLRVEEIEGSEFRVRMRQFVSQYKWHEHLRTLSYLYEHLSLLARNSVTFITILPRLAAKGRIAGNPHRLLLPKTTLLALLSLDPAHLAQRFLHPAPPLLQLRGQPEHVVVDADRKVVALILVVEGEI